MCRLFTYSGHRWPMARLFLHLTVHVCMFLSVAQYKYAKGAHFSNTGNLPSMENAQRLLATSAYSQNSTSAGPFSCAAAVEYNGTIALLVIGGNGSGGGGGDISSHSASAQYYFGNRFITYTVGRNLRDVSSANKIIYKNTASFEEKQFTDITADRLSISLAENVHDYTKRAGKPLLVNTIVMDRSVDAAIGSVFPLPSGCRESKTNMVNRQRIFKVDLSGDALACKAACIGTASPALAEQWMAANYQNLLDNCSANIDDSTNSFVLSDGRNWELQCVQFVKNAIFRGILDAERKGLPLQHECPDVQLTIIRNKLKNCCNYAEPSKLEDGLIPADATVVMGPLCIPKDYYVFNYTGNCTESGGKSTSTSAPIVDIDIESFYRDYIIKRDEVECIIRKKDNCTGTCNNYGIGNVLHRTPCAPLETVDQKLSSHKRPSDINIISVALPRSELLRRGIIKTKWKKL